MRVKQRITLCSIVTRSVLPEFRLLKYSFELFHGSGYKWFLRTDRSSANALAKERGVTCAVFTEDIGSRPDIECADFRIIVGEKMNALQEAWNSGGSDSVLFLDADLVITGRLLTLLESIPGQVLLTPNYYPEQHTHFVSAHGYYNSGLVLSRTRDFHEWWRMAFTSQPTRWTDQAVLNEARAHFTIGTIPSSANIGFWRSASPLVHPPIPADCSCLHVHFLQPLRSVRQWIDRAFAVHCLEFLGESKCPRHRALWRQVLATDLSGWYQATLRIR